MISRAILDAAENDAQWGERLLTDAYESDTDLLATAAVEGCVESVLVLMRRGIGLSYDLSYDSYDFDDDPYGEGFCVEVLAARNGHFHVSCAVLDEFKAPDYFNYQLLKAAVVSATAENGGIALLRRLASQTAYLLNPSFSTELSRLSVLWNGEAAKVLFELNTGLFKDNLLAFIPPRGNPFIRERIFAEDNAEPLRTILALGMFSRDELKHFAWDWSNAPLCFFELTAHLFARKVVSWKFRKQLFSWQERATVRSGRYAAPDRAAYEADFGA